MEQKHTLKPYLIQAVYNWCSDIKNTIYLEVQKCDENKIPDFVFSKSQPSDLAVFNISKGVAIGLVFEQEGLSFKTKIDNSVLDIFVNYHCIKKIFSKEMGVGLDFSSFSISEKDTMPDLKKIDTTFVQENKVEKKRKKSTTPAKLVLVVNNTSNQNTD